MIEKSITECPNCLQKVSFDSVECAFCKAEFYSCSACNAINLETDKVCRNCKISFEDEVNQPEVKKFYKGEIRFEPLNSLSGILKVIISFLILISIVSIYTSFYEISILKSRLNEQWVGDEDLTKLIYLDSLAGISSMLAWILCAVFYFIWVYKAYKNLCVLAEKLVTFSPGWAVGTYFVPIINLYRPYQIMKEIWIGSQSIDQVGSEQINHKTTGYKSKYFLAVWWGLFLVNSLFNYLSISLSSKAETVGSFITYNWFNIVTEIESIILSFLFIYLITEITSLQKIKSKSIPARICISCGKEIHLNSLYCVHCGSRLLLQ